jgi:nicotinic acid phosphoribosyltransferase
LPDFFPKFKQIIFSNHIFFCRYKASGIRLDSGDLAYLSIEARKVFRAVEKEFNVPGFGRMVITASNDLNEETIDALNKQVINLSWDQYLNLSKLTLPM